VTRGHGRMHLSRRTRSQHGVCVEFRAGRSRVRSERAAVRRRPPPECGACGVHVAACHAPTRRVFLATRVGELGHLPAGIRRDRIQCNRLGGSSPLQGQGVCAALGAQVESCTGLHQGRRSRG